MKKTSKKFQKVIRSSHLTICEVAEKDEIAKTTCCEIITENLGIHHVDVSKGLVNCANADDNFLKNFVTGDET